jgi:CRAL/TRIO domain
MFFSTVWGWIKRWFDPITVAKIFILSHHEVKPTLEKFVDPKNIPKKYGGQLEWNWGDKPTADPAWEGVVRWENGFDNFPDGPMIWRDCDGGTRRECIVIGHVDGKERNTRIATIPKTWPSPEPEPEVNGAPLEASVEAPAEPVESDAAPPTEPKTAGTNFLKLTQTPAAVAEKGNPMDKAVEGEEQTTMEKGIEKLTVSEANTAVTKATEPEVSEKVPEEEVSPALPTTVV